MSIPIVAIIGRPNVGKSTLFNRIIHKQVAITDDLPGVTRDRNAHEFEWNSRRFLLVDTGGFVVSSADTMEKAVCEQSLLAIGEADLVLFLADVKTGVTDLDTDIRDVLVKCGKPVILGVSKVDTSRDEFDMYEFYNLGLGDPYPVSGTRGRGTGDLLDAIVEALPPETGVTGEEEQALRIAFIGRPNVGKSSLVNALTGKTSVLVTDIPGTTRDSTDTHLAYNGRRVVLVDTAGLRKTSKLKESIEYYSSLRTFRSLERCDVAIVVVDMNDGLTSYEKRLVEDVTATGKGLIIAANKWDLIEKDHTTMKKLEQDLRDELADKTAYPIVFTSAVTGQRVAKLVETALSIEEERGRRIPTADLNRFMESFRMPPTAIDVSILYATQYGTKPPSFAFFVNDIRKVKDNLVRYTENQLRSVFGFGGTPIKITFRPRGRKGKKQD